MYVRSYSKVYLNIFTVPLEYLQVNNSPLVTKMYYYTDDTLAQPYHKYVTNMCQLGNFKGL